MQILEIKSKVNCVNIIPEGVSPLCVGYQPKALVSRKLVFRKECSEGSDTTKVGTDEQELNIRHIGVG